MATIYDQQSRDPKKTYSNYYTGYDFQGDYFAKPASPSVFDVDRGAELQKELKRVAGLSKPGSGYAGVYNMAYSPPTTIGGGYSEAGIEDSNNSYVATLKAQEAEYNRQKAINDAPTGTAATANRDAVLARKPSSNLGTNYDKWLSDLDAAAKLDATASATPSAANTPGTTPGSTTYTPPATMPTTASTSGAASAATGASNNLDDILALADVTNAQNLKAATAQYQALPGYDASLANVGRTIGQETAGELPSDVVNQLGQRAAERGIGSGTGFRNADYLKALGLTSLDMTQRGQSNLNAATAALPHPGLYDPSKMYTTYTQAQELELSKAQLALQQGQLSIAEYNAITGRIAAQNRGSGGGGNGGGSGGGTGAAKPTSNTANIQKIIDTYTKPTPQTGGSGTMEYPGANPVVSQNLQGINDAESNAYWDAWFTGTDQQPDYSNYFDYGDTSQTTPDYSAYV